MSDSRSFLFFGVMFALSISLSPGLVNTILLRGLCFPTIISPHKHAPRHTISRGVSFIPSHDERHVCRPCSCESRRLCLSYFSQTCAPPPPGKLRLSLHRGLRESDRGEEKRGGTRAIKREHMLTCLSTWWLQSMLRESEVIICKKWITLRLDCWALKRRRTVCSQASSPTHTHTHTLYSH